MRPPLHVSLLQRRPFPGQFSIEGIAEGLARDLPDAGIDARRHIAPVQSRGLGPRLAIARFARAHQGEVTHITGDITFAALALDPRRTVVTIHDCEPLEWMTGVRREGLRRFWYAAPARHAAAVTTVSERTKARLLVHVPGLDPDKVHVIPNAVAPAFRPLPQPRRAGPPVVLQIGTKHNKNVPRLLAALEGMDIVLHLVGPVDAALAADLARRRIRHETFRDLTEAELVARYAACDVVAFASLAEGFGMPIVEAQTVGRPVVASRTTALPEVAGRGAHFVDPEDVGEIRAALTRVLGDAAHRARLVEAGFANARRFARPRVVTAYADLYRHIARTGGARARTGAQVRTGGAQAGAPVSEARTGSARTGSAWVENAWVGSAWVGSAWPGGAQVGAVPVGHTHAGHAQVGHAHAEHAHTGVAQAGDGRSIGARACPAHPRSPYGGASPDPAAADGPSPERAPRGTGTAILVSTYARNEAYLDLVRHAFTRNWPQHPPLWVLTDGPPGDSGDNSGGGTRDEPDIIRVPRADFVTVLANGLTALDARQPGLDRIYLILEDLCPLWPVDAAALEALAAGAAAAGIDAVAFPTFPWRRREAPRSVAGQTLYRVPEAFPFPNQLQPGLWRLAYLADLVEGLRRAGVTDPWHFEKHRLDGQRPHYVAALGWPSVHHGFLRGGRVNPGALADPRVADPTVRRRLTRAACGSEREVVYAATSGALRLMRRMRHALAGRPVPR